MKYIALSVFFFISTNVKLKITLINSFLNKKIKNNNIILNNFTYTCFVSNLTCQQKFLIFFLKSLFTKKRCQWIFITVVWLQQYINHLVADLLEQEQDFKRGPLQNPRHKAPAQPLTHHTSPVNSLFPWPKPVKTRTIYPLLLILFLMLVSIVSHKLIGFIGTDAIKIFKSYNL